MQKAKLAARFVAMSRRESIRHHQPRLEPEAIRSRHSMEKARDKPTRPLYRSYNVSFRVISNSYATMDMSAASKIVEVWS
jgi:hypothetical protein